MFDYTPAFVKENLHHEEYFVEQAELKSLNLLKQYYDHFYAVIDESYSGSQTQSQSQQEKLSLELYSLRNCPFCKKVLKFMAKEGIQIPIKDIKADPAARHQLIQIGGKGQVPCLVIDQKQALYESNDIIAWLKKNRDCY